MGANCALPQVTRTFLPVFEKKPKIKIYFFVKIRPTVIEMLTFNI